MPRQAFLPSPRRTPSRKESITVHLRRPPRDSVIPRHQHFYGQLTWPKRGGIRLAAGGASWIVPVFRAIWIPPNVAHELVMLGDVEFHVVYVYAPVAPLPQDKCCAVQISSLMRSLIQTLADKGADDSQRHKLAMALLLEEIRAAAPLQLGLPVPTDRRLSALCSALMDDPASSKNLSEWADWVGASERTIARLFQSELQTSFGAWRQQLRLARAADLLGRGMQLADIAEALGYANAGAFSTMFKRALGAPPSQFFGSLREDDSKG